MGEGAVFEEGLEALAEVAGVGQEGGGGLAAGGRGVEAEDHAGGGEAEGFGDRPLGADHLVVGGAHGAEVVVEGQAGEAEGEDGQDHHPDEDRGPGVAAAERHQAGAAEGAHAERQGGAGAAVAGAAVLAVPVLATLVPAFHQGQQRRQQQEGGGQAEEDAGACEPAELEEALEVGQKEGEEGGGGGGRAHGDAAAGGAQHDAGGGLRRAAAAALLAVALQEHDGEVHPQAHQQGGDAGGERRQAADGHRRQAAGQGEAGQERQHHQDGGHQAAEGEEEEEADGGEGEAGVDRQVALHPVDVHGRQGVAAGQRGAGGEVGGEVVGQAVAGGGDGPVQDAAGRGHQAAGEGDVVGRAGGADVQQQQAAVRADEIATHRVGQPAGGLAQVEAAGHQGGEVEGVGPQAAALHLRPGGGEALAGGAGGGGQPLGGEALGQLVGALRRHQEEGVGGELPGGTRWPIR